ncbi:hypothetical protein L195_g037699, partial [Trifolium pratense]
MILKNKLKSVGKYSRIGNIWWLIPDRGGYIELLEDGDIHDMCTTAIRHNNEVHIHAEHPVDEPKIVDEVADEVNGAEANDSINGAEEVNGAEGDKKLKEVNVAEANDSINEAEEANVVVGDDIVNETDNVINEGDNVSETDNENEDEMSSDVFMRWIDVFIGDLKTDDRL